MGNVRKGSLCWSSGGLFFTFGCRFCVLFSGGFRFRRNFAKRLCAGKKGHDLALHVTEIFETDAGIENYERFACATVLIDAYDCAVGLLLRVALDEDLGAI